MRTQAQFVNLAHTQREIFDAVHGIPADAADAVAALFSILADELRRMAATSRETTTRRHTHHKQRQDLQQIPVLITERLNAGLSLEEAKLDVQCSLNVPPDTIDAWWRLHLKRRPAIERREKAIKARQMMAAGYTNADIAQALGVSRRTVCRFLKRP